MKILTRGFSKKEKILLAVLAVILVALCYYHFVYQSSKEAIEQAQAEQESQTTEIQILSAQLSRLQDMEAELEETKAEGKASYMPSYNAKKAELQFLNSVLQKSDEYNITFTELTRNSEQIRRSFTLEFTAKNYAAAEALIEELYQSENRCLIKDIVINGKKNNNKTGADITENTVKCNLTATFYETMYGGTADSALPEDLDKKAEAEALVDEDSLS